MRITNVRARALRSPDPPGNRRAAAMGDADRGGAALQPAGAFRNSPVLMEPEALTVVEVETDEGLTGYGTVGGFAVGSASVINTQFAPLLVNADPARIEALWDRLYLSLGRQGLRGTAMMAISGVDLALWDLLGKATGRPVYDLIGGKSKPRVPVYMSAMPRLDDLDALADEVARHVHAGFGAVKYSVALGAREGPAGARAEIEKIGRIREAAGTDVQVMVDAHHKWDLPFAQRMIERMAAYDIAWLENPLPIDDLAGYERLARMEAVPLAAGETERTRFPFVDLINAGVFYLQPDINRVGGLTEALRICGLAASHNRPVCPHQGWLHSWHLITASTTCVIGEYFPKRDPLPGNSLIWVVLEGEPEAAAGFIDVPERPGFGWTLNEAEVARRAV